MRTLAVFAVTLLSWASIAAGQTQITSGGFLVIDQERLFSDSAYGLQILSEVQKATEVLVAENRGIESDLIAEEKALTDQRPSLSAEEFRELADEFDDNVQRIRAEQDAKSDNIGARLDLSRRQFFQAIVPILAELLRESKALAILDKRTVLISVNLIDVTDTAIDAINRQLPAEAATEAWERGQVEQ